LPKEPTSVTPEIPSRAFPRRQNAAQDLRDEIKQLLLDRGLRPGDAMPSETTLIEILGVSRGSLREALKSLQALEIIETRHGSGMFVGHLSLTAMADGLTFHSQLGEGQDDLSTAADLADIREILETVLIRRVATSITAGDLDQLDVLLDEMADAIHGGETIDDIDRRFHALLYAQVGNALVLQLMDVFWRALSSVRDALPAPFDNPDDSVTKHRAIVDALRNADADAAETAMIEHFARTREWIHEGNA
jgi:DNA-binding FadR family transcriptional regulator